MSPDYAAYLEYEEIPNLRSREAFIENYRAFIKSNPQYSFPPISLIADVYEKNGTAAV